MLQAIGNAYSKDEVAVFAVNWGEPLAIVEDYLADTGVRAPILMDSGLFAHNFGLSDCFETAGDASLTEHFQLRVGDPKFDPPFPIHVLIDHEGRYDMQIYERTIKPSGMDFIFQRVRDGEPVRGDGPHEPRRRGPAKPLAEPDAPGRAALL